MPKYACGNKVYENPLARCLSSSWWSQYLRDKSSHSSLLCTTKFLRRKKNLFCYILPFFPGQGHACRLGLGRGHLNKKIHDSGDNNSLLFTLSRYTPPPDSQNWQKWPNLNSHICSHFFFIHTDSLSALLFINAFLFDAAATSSIHATGSDAGRTRSHAL